MSILPISAIGGSGDFVKSIGPSPLANLAGIPQTASTGTGDQTFGAMLKGALEQVNQSQLHANDLAARFAAGEPIDVHKVMVASEEASVALNLAVQVRNKLTDAYTQLMQTSM